MPEQHSVIVLAPHPDDETFGCGGTIAMLTQSGIAVDVAFMTRGEQGTDAGAPAPDESRQLGDLRMREAKAACEVLGIRESMFLPGNDTRLSEQPELATSLAHLLQKGGYHRVFCPWQDDAHDDHRATFSLLQRAVSAIQREQSFWLYEVWTPLVANTIVPIDLTIGVKRQAMDKYQSQLPQLNYLDGFLGLAGYRSLFCPGSSYAEAFWVGDQQELLQIGRASP